MAKLDAGKRAQVHADFMRSESRGRGEFSITKAQLKEAADAMDDWIDANLASFNIAIPQPARNALTPRQKAGLFFEVLAKRYEVEG